MQLPFYRVMCWIYEKNNYLLLRKSCSRYYNQEEDSEEINVINACRFWLKCQEYLYSLMVFSIFSGETRKDGSIWNIFQFYSHPENTISQKKEGSLRGHCHLKFYFKGHLRAYLKGPCSEVTTNNLSHA